MYAIRSYYAREKRLSLISRIIRWVTLGSLLVFVIAATALHTLGYVGPSIHALCPYGGLESMLSLVAVGTFLKRIVIGTFVLFGTTVVFVITSYSIHYTKLYDDIEGRSASPRLTTRKTP